MDTTTSVDKLCRVCGRDKDHISCIGSGLPPDAGGLVAIAIEDTRRELILWLREQVKRCGPERSGRAVYKHVLAKVEGRVDAFEALWTVKR